LTGPLEGFDAVLVELSFPPSGSAPEHRHPGFILGYVMEGQMRFAVNHEPDEIVPPGAGPFARERGSVAAGLGCKDAHSSEVASL
jgi:hypothetical protein